MLWCFEHQSICSRKVDVGLLWILTELLNDTWRDDNIDFIKQLLLDDLWSDHKVGLAPVVVCMPNWLWLLDFWDPFYWHVLTIIPAWISNHMPSKVWDEITYPFLNFNGCTIAV